LPPEAVESLPGLRTWQLTAVALLLCVFLIGLCVISPWKPILILLAASGGVFFVIAALRHPQLFLAAAIFIPQWKGYWPLRPIDQAADLTVLMLVGISIGLLWRTLRHLSRLDSWNIKELFRGIRLPIFFYLAFISLVAVSYLYTSAPNYGAAKLTRFLFIGGLLFFSGLMLIREESDLRNFCLFFVICGAITAIQLIFHLEQRNQVADVNSDITRIGAGWLMGMSILLLVAYPIFRKPAHRLTAWILVLPLLGSALVASAARGAIVPLLILIPLTFFIFAKQRLNATSAFLAAVLIASCVVAYFSLKRADPDKYSSKVSELLQMSEGKATSGSGGKRLDYYQKTIAAIPNNLWFGKGVGSWGVFYYGIDKRNYPHNLFLEIAYEEGMLGLTLFLALILTVISIAHRMLQATRYRYGALAGLLFYCLFVSMFSGDLDDNRLLWFWIGVTLAVCRSVNLAPWAWSLSSRAYPRSLMPGRFSAIRQRQPHPSVARYA